MIHDALQASESNILRGMEALLKAQGKRQEEDAKRRAAQQKQETLQQLQAAGERVVSDVSARLTENSRQLVTAVTHQMAAVVKEAMREGVPSEVAGPGAAAEAHEGYTHLLLLALGVFLCFVRGK